MLDCRELRCTIRRKKVAQLEAQLQMRSLLLSSLADVLACGPIVHRLRCCRLRWPHHPSFRHVLCILPASPRHTPPCPVPPHLTRAALITAPSAACLGGNVACTDASCPALFVPSHPVPPCSCSAPPAPTAPLFVLRPKSDADDACLCRNAACTAMFRHVPYAPLAPPRPIWPRPISPLIIPPCLLGAPVRGISDIALNVSSEGRDIIIVRSGLVNGKSACEPGGWAGE